MTAYKQTELTLAQSINKVSYEPRPAPYPMRLNVPFCDKDQVRALGAKWNATVRAWFVPADKDMNKFTRWLP